MNTLNLSNYERLMIKRQKKRKKAFRSFIIILILAAVTVGGFFAHRIITTGSIFSKALNVKTQETPDYVDEQLIHLGDARTGVKLIKVNNIVIHYTGNPGSTAQNNRDYFDKSDTDVCSHFVIGLDGEIIQCVPLDEKSAASNNRNLDTISIEVCHPDESGKFTDESYNSLVKLTAWLCDNSNLKAKDVIRHNDITGKECPKYFVDNIEAWEEFLDDVSTELKKY